MSHEPVDAISLLAVHDRAAWRAWLAAHSATAASAWVAIYKQGPLKTTLTFEDAQSEALCFGWVDVKNKRLDDQHYALLFSPRRAGSAWSITNIQRVEQLTAAGQMTAPGLACVAEAQANGQWQLGLRVEQTDLVPPVLEAALQQADALPGYNCLSHSRKRQLLRWLLTAKTPVTQARRIAAIVHEAQTAPIKPT
ncbi:MAG: YdeI/OmpD-associated family protein [Anaerolineae bacterium]